MIERRRMFCLSGGGVCNVTDVTSIFDQMFEDATAESLFAIPIGTNDVRKTHSVNCWINFANSFSSTRLIPVIS